MPLVLGKSASRFLRSYYRGPDHPLKLRVWYGILKLLSNPRLTVPYAEGGWISLSQEDLLQREILVSGSYELEVWQTLEGFLDSAEVIWDVGAHIGTFAIRAMLDGRVREVHAFEPEPNTRELLSMNLSLNSGKCFVHVSALSDRKEIRRLYRGPSANTGLSSLAFQVSDEGIDLDCITADELIEKHHLPAPSLMKIDVEGWEFNVLKGARRLLRDSPPKAIAFESESDATGEMVDKSLRSYLEGLGYGITRIPRLSGIVDTRENFLAVPAADGSTIV